MTTTYSILGCTGCGKAAVGRALAQRIGGQILSVDSMKVYRRMDIGTAKPTRDAQQQVPHFGLDLVEPSETFSVAQYLAHADDAIAQIREAGAIPLAVGGTNLYIQALCEGLFEGPGADPSLREQLRQQAESSGLAALHEELQRVDPISAARIHPNDERRILRALEVFLQSGQPISALQTQWEAEKPARDVVRIGLRREKESQSRRINRRVKTMIERGLVDEVRALLDEPAGLSDVAGKAVGYAEFFPYFEGLCSLDDAIERVKINTRRLAKKQRTWQRRWQDVIWFDLADDESVEAIVERILAKVEFA